MDCIVTTELIAAASRAPQVRIEPTPPLPTLGDILDRIAGERPGWTMACDPALRGSRVELVRIATAL